VLDLAKAIESNSNNRANGSLIMHTTVAIEGMMISSENGEFYKMKTTCERPEPLKQGGYMDEV
jgi:hypothetical protein